jgi:hypothetical protein
MSRITRSRAGAKNETTVAPVLSSSAAITQDAASLAAPANGQLPAATAATPSQVPTPGSTSVDTGNNLEHQVAPPQHAIKPKKTQKKKAKAAPKFNPKALTADQERHLKVFFNLACALSF